MPTEEEDQEDVCKDADYTASEQDSRHSEDNDVREGRR